jgi:hypothetical protein
MQMALVYVQQAKASDASQRDIRPDQITPWISGR